MDKPIRVQTQVLKILEEIKKEYRCSYSTAILIAVKGNDNVDERIRNLELSIEEIKKKLAYA